MEPEKVIDSVETAKDELEKAEENLERAETHEEIERVKNDAQLAIEVAFNSSDRVAEVSEELREQTESIEENSEWQIKQIHELAIQMDSLRAELLTLAPSEGYPSAVKQRHLALALFIAALPLAVLTVAGCGPIISSTVMSGEYWLLSCA